MPDEEDQALAVYEALRRLGSAEPALMGDAADLDQEQAAAALRRLDALGLVHSRADGQLEAVEPDTALVRAMDMYHRAAEDHASRAESLYEATQALLYTYRPAVERVSSKVEIESITDPRAKVRVVAAMNATAQNTADSLHPGPMPPMELLELSLEQDTEMLKRGIQMRAIYTQKILQSPKHLRYLERLSEAGVNVRLIDHAPFDILLQDRDVACLPADPYHPGGSPMLLVRSTWLVWPLQVIFEDYWLRAVPLADAVSSNSGTTAFTPQEQVVIRLMATGLTDDQIARKMGVHRRTVQRAVSKLMDRLHAGSRFEAGLKLGQDPELARALSPNRNRGTGARGAAGGGDARVPGGAGAPGGGGDRPPATGSPM
ncbi:LuxR C-terminal-related transcriptional regulator [Actinacidiphila sp. bgisy144]|uniref:helix-turn-helix transcriptional regulator n=1 Tax=Actinacidiphila sp. bgisy144 TaxID=3413791 RepID=UPI003EBD4A5E